MTGENLHEKLRKMGLTEYEAKTYLCLLEDRIATASKISSDSGVPRTKVYSVLESLTEKGWVSVYSGVPILFRAARPSDVFEQIKKEYGDFLESVKKELKGEVSEMEKFVIKRTNVGLEALKGEMKKAKTIVINNATMGFIKKVADAFSADACVRVLLFPKEKKPEEIGGKNIEFKEANIKIVSIVKNKEVPSMSIMLDESRVFTAMEDPFEK
jgi:sugar-specific transcriptional regulator TrmB